MTTLQRREHVDILCFFFFWKEMAPMIWSKEIYSSIQFGTGWKTWGLAKFIEDLANP